MLETRPTRKTPREGYSTACKVETHSCRHATKAANKEKNQNQKSVPYDYNRVVLDSLEDQPDSDYVNASYVDSLLKPNAYIVTQGPTENTVSDFWRMVWQEKASCIVMLTKTFDFIKVMCMQYWPASKEKDETHGGISISVLKEEELANFHIRTFLLSKKEEGSEVAEERRILQFHYTEWHSHTDGGGRSGVYLAIDANLELAEEEDCFDVFGYLKKLRQSRKGLIESLDQYKFVYDTLEEFVVCGASWFPVTELSQRLKQKSLRNPMIKMNDYQREYQQICKQTTRYTIGDCAGGHRGDNREKNRDVLIVPPDNSRPYLTSFQGNNFTDYINAVFVDESESIHRRAIAIPGEEYRRIVSLTELMAGVKAPAKTVQLFQLGCWPMGHKVPTSTNSLVELMNMVERWRQRTDYGPVVVVSPDGRSRCGVYCAANACIEQVIQHGEVDIFQAVKTQETQWYIEFGRGSALPQTPEDPSYSGDAAESSSHEKARCSRKSAAHRYRWNCCSCELLSPCADRDRSRGSEEVTKAQARDKSSSKVASIYDDWPAYSGEVVAATYSRPRENVLPQDSYPRYRESKGIHHEDTTPLSLSAASLNEHPSHSGKILPKSKEWIPLDETQKHYAKHRRYSKVAATSTIRKQWSYDEPASKSGDLPGRQFIPAKHVSSTHIGATGKSLSQLNNEPTTSTSRSRTSDRETIKSRIVISKGLSCSELLPGKTEMTFRNNIASSSELLDKENNDLSGTDQIVTSNEQFSSEFSESSTDFTSDRRLVRSNEVFYEDDMNLSPEGTSSVFEHVAICHDVPYLDEVSQESNLPSSEVLESFKDEQNNEQTVIQSDVMSRDDNANITDQQIEEIGSIVEDSTTNIEESCKDLVEPELKSIGQDTTLSISPISEDIHMNISLMRSESLATSSKNVSEYEDDSQASKGHGATVTKQPRSETVATCTDQPTSETVATSTDKPESETVATITEPLKREHVATSTKRPKKEHAATSTDHPKSEHVATSTERPRSRSIGTSTDEPFIDVATSTDTPPGGSPSYDSIHISIGTNTGEYERRSSRDKLSRPQDLIYRIKSFSAQVSASSTGSPETSNESDILPKTEEETEDSTIQETDSNGDGFPSTGQTSCFPF
ncbi:hypothetical protein C0J52_08106 [Blattella germanica]|nr:hypothetical protein C0J52_08106 [Blattella germanica]